MIFLPSGGKKPQVVLPMPGLTRRRSAGLQVHDEHLVKGIAAVLFLGLEDDRLAVGRKIAFAGADESRGDLPDILEVGGFGLFPGSRVGRDGVKGQESKHGSSFRNEALECGAKRTPL